MSIPNSFVRDQVNDAVLRQFKQKPAGLIESECRFAAVEPDVDMLSAAPALESVEMFKYALPSENQGLLPSCGGHAGGNHMDVRMGQSGFEFPEGFQFNGYGIWCHGRESFHNGDLDGGLTLPEIGISMMDMQLFQPGAHVEEILDVNDLYTQVVLNNRPVVSGLMVTSSWQKASWKNGYIFYGSSQHGDRLGGHAVTVIGMTYKNDTSYVHFINSWGQNWGYNGIGTIELDAYVKNLVGTPFTIVGDLNMAVCKEHLSKV